MPNRHAGGRRVLNPGRAQQGQPVCEGPAIRIHEGDRSRTRMMLALSPFSSLFHQLLTRTDSSTMQMFGNKDTPQRNSPAEDCPRLLVLFVPPSMCCHIDGSLHREEDQLEEIFKTFGVVRRCRTWKSSYVRHLGQLNYLKNVLSDFAMLEAIASRLQAIASRVEAIASRVEAIAIRSEAIASIYIIVRDSHRFPKQPQGPLSLWPALLMVRMASWTQDSDASSESAGRCSFGSGGYWRARVQGEHQRKILRLMFNIVSGE